MNGIRNEIKDDILIISYFFHVNGWESANKISYQRVLYFAMVLSSLFVKGKTWSYDFSNTFFGPYNNEIVDALEDLCVKNILELVNRKIYSNRIEESYTITNLGKEHCEKTLFKLRKNEEKKEWFGLVVKTLSLYGEPFFSKLVKADPNVISMTESNDFGKIIADDSANNISKNFFIYLKEKGRMEFSIENDLDILLMYFDVLYRKYREEI